MERRRLLIDSVKTLTYLTAVSCGPKLPALPTPKETPKPKEDSGFKPGFIWRLNQGPHDDPVSHSESKVLYAIDIGIPEIINSEGGAKSGIKYEFNALKGGKVYRIDREHGIIHIKDSSGLIWYYEHLDLDEKLAVGKEISLYDKLGIVSFKSAPEGYSTGLHVHLGIFRKVNNDLVKQPIDGLKIGNWTVRNGKEEGKGFMVNDKGEIRQADQRICFPSKALPEPCGRDENGRIIDNGIKTPIEPY